MAAYKWLSACRGLAIIVRTCLLSPSIVLASSGSVGLTLSPTPPADISGPVSPSFAGFGIEFSNLFSYMGYSSPNPLTDNLLANLANYTGAPAHIRIGGNTQDNMIYDETMTRWSWITNPNSKGQGTPPSDACLFGPRFFEVANRLPAGTPVTWGLNLAYNADDYMTRLATVAALALDRTPNIKITSFELGNEPDLYGQNGLRAGGSWNGKAYVKEWQERATTLWKQVLSPRGRNASFFEAAATASTINTDFQVADMFTTYKIDAAPAGSELSAGTSLLAAWNQHDYYYFVGVSTYEITLAKLMQLQTTEDQFTAWAAQVKQAQGTPYPYALREMGIVGPIGLEGITDVFGTALWTLNFLCYAASLGVESVQLHMTDNSNASAWQPIEMYGKQPFVRPVYYGVAAFDQVIGDAGPGARVWQYPVGELSVPVEYVGQVRAYVVYDANNALASVVVINGRVSNASVAEADKPLLNVQLKLPSSLAGQTIHLARLTGTGADATKDTTWNGISYEASGNGIPTIISNANETVQVGSDGSATFPVRDTQAVVGAFGRKVGSGAAGAGTPSSDGGTNITTATTSAHVKQPTTSPCATTSSPDPTAPTNTHQSGAMLLEASLALLVGAWMLL
ncbi:glycoside hydrolase family 79 protein [Xylariaceae sp. AK1471]|nr:glycoside hydrolase family 79 protein [Xylariaceae sp. AK1471]